MNSKVNPQIEPVIVIQVLLNGVCIVVIIEILVGEEDLQASISLEVLVLFFITHTRIIISSRIHTQRYRYLNDRKD
jgi:hypothetical protein